MSNQFDKLVHQLEHGNAFDSRLAAEALGQLGDTRALQPLVDALKSSVWTRRLGSASALGQLGDPRAIEPLIAALKDEKSSVRSAAKKALGQLAEPRTAQQFVAALEDGTPLARQVASGILGDLGDERAVEPLIAALGDVDRDVRLSVVRDLGRLGDPRAAEPLIGQLDDPDPAVRRGVIAALAQMGEASAVEPLAAALKDSAPDVRQSALEALGRLVAAGKTEEGKGAALEAVMAALEGSYGQARGKLARIFPQMGDSAAPLLVVLLKDDDPRVRHALAQVLPEMGETGFHLLVHATNHASTEVRAAAARFLGELGDERAVDALVRALGDREVEVRRACIAALRAVGAGRAWASVVAALNDSDAIVRRAASEILGDLGDLRAVEPLAAALRDPDRDVRLSAVGALDRLGAPSAISSLVVALSDPNWRVREATTRVLGSRGDEGAIDPLIVALEDAQWPVRSAAAEALRRVGDGRAVGPLINTLGDGSAQVRGAAVTALSALGSFADEQALESLARALDHGDRHTCTAAAQVLGRWRDPRAGQILAWALGDETSHGHMAAALVLGQQGDRRAAPALIAALWEPSAHVRATAAQLLGALGDERAARPLIHALSDESLSVRANAARALGQLGDVRAVEPLLDVLRREDLDVWGAAVSARELLRNEQMVRSLLESLVSDASPRLQQAVARAVAQWAPRWPGLALRLAFGDSMDADWILAEYGTEAAVDLLLELYREELWDWLGWEFFTEPPELGEREAPRAFPEGLLALGPEPGMEEELPPEEELAFPPELVPKGETGTLPKPRWLQAQVYEVVGLGLTRLERGLRAGAEHQLDVWIGPAQAGAIVAPELFPEDLLPPDRDGYELQILFWEANAVPHLQTGKIWLPKGVGNSTVSPFRFRVRPRVAHFEGRLQVLYGNRLLQTMLLTAPVLADPTLAPPRSRIEFRLDTPVRVTPAGVDLAHPRGPAFFADTPAGGTPHMAVAAGDRVALRSLEGVDRTIRLIRSRLEQIADAPDAFLALKDPATETLLRFLARQGRLLYNVMTGTYLQGFPLADDLPIQVVSARESFLPIEFMYDRPAPSSDATLCPMAAVALEDGKCQECLKTEEEAKKYVCPLGFWCMRRVIERHAVKPLAESGLEGAEYALAADPTEGRDTLNVLSSAVYAASNKVRPDDVEALRATLAAATGEHVEYVRDWTAWREAVQKANPSLLVLLPHTLRDVDQIPTLEIGELQQLPEIDITRQDVRGQSAPAPPVVLLLGCETAVPDIPFQNFATQFRISGAAIVLNTLAPVLGRHVVPVAQMLVEELKRVDTPRTTFGAILLAVRRRGLARGLPVVLSLVAYGDADWGIGRE
jgi:HEAT repeat protein